MITHRAAVQGGSEDVTCPVNLMLLRNIKTLRVSPKDNTRFSVKFNQMPDLSNKQKNLYLQHQAKL